MLDRVLIAELESLLERAKKGEKVRTPRQNNSLHKYLTNLANALNEAGLDQRIVLKPDVMINWDLHSAKNQLWRPVQREVAHKESSADLTTKEIQEVYEFMHRHFSEKFGLDVEWPADHPPTPENP